MRAWLAGALLLVLCVPPGLLLASRLLPERSAVERRTLGVAAGFAMLVISAEVATFMAHPEWAIVLLLGATAAIFAGLKRPRLQSGQTPAGFAGDRASWALCVAAVTIAGVWFAAPVISRALPAGWDPGFHVAAIELIRKLGRVPETWAPYAPQERFNYPPALHCTLALLARLSGLAADEVFTIALVILGLLVLWEVWLVGAVVGGHVLAGVGAALLVGLTGGWGALANQAEWGGLANLAGLAFFFPFLLTTLRPSRGALALATLFAIGIAVTHHLTFALVLFGVVVLALLEWGSERRLSPPLRAAIWPMGLAIATAGVLTLLKPVGRFQLSEALKYRGEFFMTLPKLVGNLGIPMLILGGWGIRHMLRNDRDPVGRLIPGWAIALAAYWALFDPIYRTASVLRLHKSYTAFGPSRGLTNAMIFLALAAGIALWRASSRRGAAVAVLLTLGIVLMGAGASAESKRLSDAKADQQAVSGIRDACAAVRDRTPPDAVIFAGANATWQEWFPYLCDRETNYFPNPAFRVPMYRHKKQTIEDPSLFARFIRSTSSRSVYDLSQEPMPDLAGGLRWQGSGWYLYEVNP